MSAPNGNARRGGLPPRTAPLTVRVARGQDDILTAVALRAAVYLAEQGCPFAEEFDGNDTVATHLIGFVGGEPAGTLRIRFFGGFAKVERVAVRREYRGTALASALVVAAAEHSSRKGFRDLYGHPGEGLERLWQRVLRRFGSPRPLHGGARFGFSGQDYGAFAVDLPAVPEALDLGTDPMVLNRPEGDWDTPGVLERGAHAQPPPAPVAWVISSDGNVHPIAGDRVLSARIRERVASIVTQGHAYVGVEGGYLVALPPRLRSSAAAEVLKVVAALGTSFGDAEIWSPGETAGPKAGLSGLLVAVAQACAEEPPNPGVLAFLQMEPSAMPVADPGH